MLRCEVQWEALPAVGWKHQRVKNGETQIKWNVIIHEIQMKARENELSEQQQLLSVGSGKLMNNF